MRGAQPKEQCVPLFPAERNNLVLDLPPLGDQVIHPHIWGLMTILMSTPREKIKNIRVIINKLLQNLSSQPDLLCSPAYQVICNFALKKEAELDQPAFQLPPQLDSAPGLDNGILEPRSAPDPPAPPAEGTMPLEGVTVSVPLGELWFRFFCVSC